MPHEHADDPVFGALAQRLQPRALGWPDAGGGEGAQGGPSAGGATWTRLALRREALDDSALRRLPVRPGSWPGAVPRAAGELRLDLDLEGLRRAAEGETLAAVLLAAHEGRARAGTAPRLMGIVNVTPDSFSDGGLCADSASAVAHGYALAGEGAAILDVGGESTRPGAAPVSEPEELRRTIPVIAGLAGRSPAAISIDTTKSAVARAALAAGATIVNDVSAGRFDPAILAAAAECGAVYVAMHMQGTPRDMQADPRYGDVVADVLAFLRERCAVALAAGIAREHLWVDPGFGFGKRLEHNLELLRRLPELRSLGLPLLVGVSRKSFLTQATGSDTPPEQRQSATAAAVAAAVLGGAQILRVHDVALMREAAALAWALSQRR